MNKRGKVSLKDTILFQVGSLNILMLIAFIIVMVLVVGAMNKTTSTSEEMFHYVVKLNNYEAKLKNDLMSLYDQTTVNRHCPKRHTNGYRFIKQNI